LLSLLQQVNLLPAPYVVSSPSSVNRVHTSHVLSSISTIHFGISSSPFSCSISSKSDIWLLDSCANDHIVSSPHWFTLFHKITPKPVNLPNGSSVLVEYADTIHFTHHFYLDSVLYSPSFNLNLISISKICISLQCFATFHDNKCLLQDLHSQNMIGLGDQVEGLYRLVLDFSAFRLHNTFSVNHVSTNKNFTIPSSTLWHFRLAHVSHNRLSHMSKLYPSLTFDHKAACDICHFAKQKQLPFTNSLLVDSSKFELLHFDIWGPLSITFVHNHRYFLIILDDYSR